MSLFFDDLLDAKLREFNPRYAEAEGALLGQFRHLHADIYGNREFVEHLRNRGKFFDHEEKRERDLILIDYDDPARNVYEVTEEWAFHNGHYGTREDGAKVINLIKSIEQLAQENSDDPCLIAMAERARAVQESFEQRQTSTAKALAELLREVAGNEARKKEQAEKSFDGLTYFVYRSLLDAKIENAETVSRYAFSEFPNWKRSENALRELRKKVTFAIFAETDDLERVMALVDALFTLLEKAERI